MTNDARRVWWMRRRRAADAVVASAPGAAVYAQDVLTGATRAFPWPGGAVGGPVAVTPDGARLARAVGTSVLLTDTGLPKP